MKLTAEIRDYIEQSVLCWLATTSEAGIPNVSPKECFAAFGEDSIIVANIASPQTVKNIGENPNVCLSFIEVFVQKGYQLKGKAEIVSTQDPDYAAMKQGLEAMTLGKFPFRTITRIKLESAKPILAPSYLLFPETTEAQQIASAKKRYGQ